MVWWRFCGVLVVVFLWWCFCGGGFSSGELDLVFGSRRRVKKVRIFRAWFSHGGGAVSALESLERKPFSRLRSEELVETLFSWN